MYSTFYAWEYPLVEDECAFDPKGVDGKVAAIAEQENLRALKDCGVIYQFSRGVMAEQPERLEELFNQNLDELLSIGGRVLELERHFNNQGGFDLSDDTLPYQEMIDGFDEALSEYYATRGWIDDGTVPEEAIITPVLSEYTGPV